MAQLDLLVPKGLSSSSALRQTRAMIVVPVRPRSLATVPCSGSIAPRPPSGRSTPSSFPLLGGVATAAAFAMSGRRTQRAAEIVDVEIVKAAKPMDSAEVKAALEVVEAAWSLASAGVPVRSQVMEYKAEPTRSPLANCGIPELSAAGTKATELLVKGLSAKVDEDSAEVAAAVLCLMSLA